MPHQDAGVPARQDYEAHFHASPCGYLVVEPDGGVRDVNATLARWLRRSREDIIGAAVLDLMPAADRVLYSAFALPQPSIFAASSTV